MFAILTFHSHSIFAALALLVGGLIVASAAGDEPTVVEMPDGALSPQQALHSFQLAEGFTIELVAAGAGRG